MECNYCGKVSEDKNNFILHEKVCLNCIPKLEQERRERLKENIRKK